MKKINENNLAKSIAFVEGKVKNQDITQIKEILKIVLDSLATEWEDGNEEGVIDLIKRHKNSNEIPF